MRQTVRAILAGALLGTSMLASVSALAAAPHLAGPVSALTAPTRAQVQYFLRRFSFSAAPEDVTAVQGSGIAAWLAAQEQPNNINDSGTELETLPTQLVNGNYPDYNIFERAVMQHMILTNRQLQAKMELHWLDHFSVGLETVGDPAIMYHYDQTIRQNALGNFATLLNAVSQEPAMLYWLSNNYNSGGSPNENFGREVMQLYSTGIFDLNMNGTIKTSAGVPVLNYSENDVHQLARAMTGYGVVIDPNNNNPQTRFSVQYFPGNHYNGTISYFGRVQPVPTDGTAINFVTQQLAYRSSTAPFEAKELLQRFVTENPSATYINNIATVWQKTEKAPDQIAQVITAIVTDPEFFNYYNSMPKQPAELVIDALRQLPGMMQSTTNAVPGGSLLYELNGLGQQLFYPPTVFSFYRPGDVESTINTGALLDRTNVFANITNANPSSSYTDTWIDIPTLLTRVSSAEGGTTGGDVAAYLLDALVDGGTPKLQTYIHGFLGAQPNATQISGAIWLLLNAPDYAVN